MVELDQVVLEDALVLLDPQDPRVTKASLDLQVQLGEQAPLGFLEQWELLGRKVEMARQGLLEYQAMWGQQEGMDKLEPLGLMACLVMMDEQVQLVLQGEMVKLEPLALVGWKGEMA